MISMPIKSVQVSKSLIGEIMLTITSSIREHNSLDEIYSITEDKKYVLELKKKKNKRSLDANAYAWVLMNKIANILETTAIEVYREQIQNIGAYEIMPVREDVLKRWIEIWESKGTGWIAEDMGACRNTKGYRNVKLWYGSSVYDTKQMARLIDEIIEECKVLGIETLSPLELSRMKEEWR